MKLAQLRFQSGASTHAGRVRESNEDAYLAAEQVGLWAVADGMGGHEHGEWASARVVAELERGPLPDDFGEACREVGMRIHRANLSIYGDSVERGVQLGTTVVVLFVRGLHFAVLWVGDSRAYLLRDSQLHQLSRDHSQVQEMLDRGLLSESEADGHPMGHVLTRAVGVADALEVDIVQDEVAAGDTFLLSTDGLHGYVGDEEIAGLLAAPTPEQCVGSLVAAALQKGAPDNVTVVAVRFVEPTIVLFDAPVVTT